MAVKTTGVRTRHRDYEKYAPKWKRCRDVMAGQDEVHAAGVAYLPKLKEQSDADYRAFRLRAGFYNASWRTVAGLSGMMFRKPPKQKLPTSIEPFLEDITMSGVPFDQFSQDVATEVLEVGRIGLLVDHPLPLVSDAPVTQAVAEKAGLRPSIVSYSTEAIINWKFRKINNQTMLCMVVLMEEQSTPDGEFNEVIETVYRVLDLNEAAGNTYRVRMFKVDREGKDVQIGADVIPLMDGKPLPYIPFVFIGPDGTDANLDEPPLIDLVDVNLAHYRVTAAYEHGVHLSALPTFWIAGFNPTADAKGVKEKIYLGSQTAIVMPDPQAKAGFAEVMNNFQTHRDNLDAKKQEMATLGARMLADTSVKQVETFGATAIKHVAENSILASIAIAVSKGLTVALGWLCDWAKAPKSGIVYDINRDFMPVQMDAPTLTALMTAWQAGALSTPELFDLFKRGDLIEADKTLEDHQGEIDAAPPPAPHSNAMPGTLGTPTAEQTSTDAAMAAKKLADAVPPPVKKAA